MAVDALSRTITPDFLHTMEVISPEKSVKRVQRDRSKNIHFSLSDGTTMILTTAGYRALKKVLPILQSYKSPKHFTDKGAEGDKYLIECIQVSAFREQKLPSFFEKRIDSKSPFFQDKIPLRSEDFVVLYQLIEKAFKDNNWQIAELLLSTQTSNYFKFETGLTMAQFLTELFLVFDEDGIDFKEKKINAFIKTWEDSLAKIRSSIVDELSALPSVQGAFSITEAHGELTMIAHGETKSVSVILDYTPRQLSANHFSNLRFYTDFYSQLRNWIIPRDKAAALGKAISRGTTDLKILQESLICVDPVLLVKEVVK